MSMRSWALFLIGGLWGACNLLLLQTEGPWVAVPMIAAGLVLCVAVNR